MNWHRKNVSVLQGTKTSLNFMNINASLVSKSIKKPKSPKRVNAKNEDEVDVISWPPKSPLVLPNSTKNLSEMD